ncbi:MAG: TrmH family RNA methyltransferase [Candidatus Levybacteria bacterium]|nr:TrmH family RNA methyltransferase [Candidatus Levybacteria bacterium]
MIKLGAQQLRTTKPSEEDLKKIKKNPIYIILDNVLDTYNVGAIFRLADTVAAEKVILCGQTETPPHTRIKKASINTTEWVAWEYVETAVEAISKLRVEFSTSLEQYSSRDQAQLGSREVQELQVIAIEQDARSIPYDKVDYKFPVALVVGHESEGVSKEVLDIADQIVELPMWGVNKSLNVMVSLGIVLYKVMEKIEK